MIKLELVISQINAAEERLEQIATQNAIHNATQNAIHNTKAE